MEAASHSRLRLLEHLSPARSRVSRCKRLSGCHHIASGDLVRWFADGRDRIEKIAINIFAMRPEGVTGTLHIWVDDIDDPPSAPPVARQVAAVLM